MPTPQDLKMRIPNVLVLLTSCLLLSADVTADYADGYVAYETGDYETALREWRALAEQGHALAQFSLGFMYDEGEGVLQDDKEAAKWYTKAAEQGQATAQYNLALMYDKGEGVLQDYKEAVKWYTKAAEQGDVDAQFMLALMYDNGEGVLQDYKEAVKWYTKAESKVCQSTK